MKNILSKEQIIFRFSSATKKTLPLLDIANFEIDEGDTVFNYGRFELHYMARG